MPVPNILDVGCTEALLRAHRPRGSRPLLAEKVGDELLDPARGQEDSGVVVGDQGRARVVPVAPLPEKIQEPSPYLATLHAPHPGTTCWSRAHVPGTQVRSAGPPARAWGGGRRAS